MESVIRGPRQGFTQDMKVNTSLIGTRLRTPRLGEDVGSGEERGRGAMPGAPGLAPLESSDVS